jgi:N-acetylmuramoyl-L-alanine amidase
MGAAAAWILSWVVAAPPLIFVDPGHGEGDNQGAQTVGCGSEARSTLDLARDLARRLQADRRFRVELSRTSTAGPAYAARVARARALGARALLSLHVDARGALAWYRTPEGRACLRGEGEAGFAILYSDEGSAGRVAKRRRLARAVARRMAEAGFVPYDGAVYGDLYALDPTPGVFIDRRGLFMLRRPSMPSVIIETHHGFLAEEHEAWQQEGARGRFAAAVAAALEDALKPGGGRGG